MKYLFFILAKWVLTAHILIFSFWILELVMLDLSVLLIKSKEVHPYLINTLAVITAFYLIISLGQLKVRTILFTLLISVIYIGGLLLNNFDLNSAEATLIRLAALIVTGLGLLFSYLFTDKKKLIIFCG